MKPIDFLNITRVTGTKLNRGRTEWIYDEDIRYRVVSERSSTNKNAEYRHFIGEGWIASTKSNGAWAECFRIRGDRDKATNDLVYVMMKYI